MSVRTLTRDDLQAWWQLRSELWPDCSDIDNQRDTQVLLQDAHKNAVFLYDAPDGTVKGFLEARLREYAEDCETSPVGFIEGWYVVPEARGSGIGRSLVEAAEKWAMSKGCTEMASDAVIDNIGSHAAHRALGYEEVERIVCFRKPLV